MSFKDVLAEQNPTRTGVRCRVGVWRETLTKEDQTEFDAAASDDLIQHAVLVRAMKQMGYQFTVAPVYKHRDGTCNCDLR